MNDDPKWGETPDGGENYVHTVHTHWDEDYPDRWWAREQVRSDP